MATVAAPAAAAASGAATDTATEPAPSWAPPPPGSERYDLTPVISAFLDRHLILPLLDFVAECELYEERDVLHWKLELLKHTSMVDFASNVYMEYHETETPPEELRVKREEVVSRLAALREECQPTLNLFRDAAVVERLSQDKQFNLRMLQENYGLKLETIGALYQFGKLQFDCGNYLAASELLYHFRVLSMDQAKNVSALWGKLASEILVQNWDAAVEDLTNLRLTIENRVLQQRSWLLHWSLFVYLNPAVKNGQEQLLELFAQPSYRHAMQTTSPHLLRYLTAITIMGRRRRENLKELVIIIQQESEHYHDPIVDFVDQLYVHFDFDAAQLKLRECQQVFAIDVFLEPYLDAFMEQARLFIFETYCKIHRRIDISMLAEKLAMSDEEAERWIVNLIRQAQFDATIDSATNTVIMGQTAVDLYQQVIERTKALALRTSLLLSNIERREAAVREQRPMGVDYGQAPRGGGGGGGGGGRGGRGGRGGGRGGRGRGSANFQRDYSGGGRRGPSNGADGGAPGSDN